MLLALTLLLFAGFLAEFWVRLKHCERINREHLGMINNQRKEQEQLREQLHTVQRMMKVE